MPWIEVQTPGRLHLGLLSWGGSARREFGGVGLMIDAPGVRVRGSTAADWSAAGPLADRVLDAAQRVAEGLVGLGHPVPPVQFEIATAPPEHIGLGVGTQVALAAARIVAGLAGADSLSAGELGRLAGRGRRSGIGVHGFALGGLIVDGGRRRGGPAAPPPLLTRLAWPSHWHVLVLIPPGRVGLHGSGETSAFRDLVPPAEATVDRLGRLVLLDLLPSVAEANLDDFGATLAEIQALIGAGFAPAQGGSFAGRDGADLVRLLKSLGLQGVGQSSWGPTLYGFGEGSIKDRELIARTIRDQTGLSQDCCFWTTANESGARIACSPDATQSKSPIRPSDQET